MPGYADWGTLYQQEKAQLYEEGYRVEKDSTQDPYLPFPDEVKKELKKEDVAPGDWEKAYKTLWEVRKEGLREDYPYVEPDGLEDILKASGQRPALTVPDEQTYREKIKGAWFGRCAAVILGKPFEMGLDHQFIRKYLESLNAYPITDWIPERSEALDFTLRQDCVPSCRGHVQYAQPDDDIHYTILALLVLQKHGRNHTKRDWLTALLDNMPYNCLWSCTKQSFYHMVNLDEGRDIDEQIAEFPLKLNPMREGINGAIRADMWGYISPADIGQAAALTYHNATINLVKNGVYASMYVTAALAAALSKEASLETILQAGKSVVPQKSRLAQAIRDVEQWYTEEKDWFPVCDKIHKKYGHLPFAGAINNMAIVVLSLMHGKLDYTKTITTAVMCGIDTDCTAGTVGSIVGAAVGYDGLDQKWIAPLHDTVHTVVAKFGFGTISGLVEQTLEVWKKGR